ncbi:hypothetical protein B0J13DRAFT_570297 [Dactylonectria estremocensis]|uniref:Uncharacterized protein n=1 Tax=Dactylonectria estremocensis TaxID=1079267 RepID=A0A9P9DET3_9HYPO|nr:hypothetical protein B0J13DRAFT_570297 [Dactylonectria estremocensis]
MQESDVNVSGQSPETQGGAAKRDRYWSSTLNPVRNQASRHLEEYLASQGYVQSEEQGPLRESAPATQLHDFDSPAAVLGYEVVPGSVAQALQIDLEVLAKLLVRMQLSAIYGIIISISCFLLVTAIALLIWLITPLHREESPSLFSTVLWSPSIFLGSESIWSLHMLYLIRRCCAITVSLQKKLAEGSLEQRDKSRLQGAFLWGTVGMLHRIHFRPEGPISRGVGTV